MIGATTKSATTAIMKRMTATRLLAPPHRCQRRPSPTSPRPPGRPTPRSCPPAPNIPYATPLAGTGCRMVSLTRSAPGSKAPRPTLRRRYRQRGAIRAGGVQGAVRMVVELAAGPPLRPDWGCYTYRNIRSLDIRKPF